MDHVRQMLDTHPQPAELDASALAECIEACFDCAQSCSACADACLGEGEHLAHLVRCIRLNLDCADICDTTGRVLSRSGGPDVDVVRAQLRACAKACRSCGEECERHGQGMGMRHCAVCADACRQCADACDRLVGSAA